MDREMQQRNWAIEGLVKGLRFPLCLSFSPNSNTYLSLLFRPITVPDGEPRKKSVKIFDNFARHLWLPPNVLDGTESDSSWHEYYFSVHTLT